MLEDWLFSDLGPHDQVIVPKHLREIDNVVHKLIEYYEKAHPGVRIIVSRDVDRVLKCDDAINFQILSEYGISPVERSVPINRFLRSAGYLKVGRWKYDDVIVTHSCSRFSRFGERTAAKRSTTERRLHSLLLIIKWLISISKIQREILNLFENSSEQDSSTRVE